MGLQAVFTEVAALTAALHPGVTSRLGAEYIASNEDPLPRVVWVRQPGRYGPPAATPGRNPRAIATRFAAIAVHVWAESYDAAELVADSVIIAMRRSAQGVFTLTNDQWVTDDGRTESEGALYVFGVEFETPVTERPQVRVAPVTATVTHKALLPSGSVSNP